MALPMSPDRWEIRAAQAEQKATHPEIHVVAHDGLLSVALRAAPLAEVLRRITEATGLRLRLEGNLDTPVTWRFAGVPVDDAMRRLVGDHTMIMIYASTGWRARRVLSEVWVYGPHFGHMTDETPGKLDRGSYEQVDHGRHSRRDGAAELQALRELARVWGEAALDSLAAVLEEEGDSTTRRVAALGLAEIGGPEALAVLTSRVGDQDRFVRMQIVQGLARVGGQEAAEALWAALKDRDSAVRLQAALALQKAGGIGSEHVLSEFLHEEADAGIRRVAVRTLEKLQTPEAWWALWDATGHPDAMVRQSARLALSRWPR